MKKIIFSFLLVPWALIGFAQNEKLVKDKETTLPQYRFEVGIDLLGLINKNNLPGYSLQLKIHNKSEKHTGAIRFKVGGRVYIGSFISGVLPDEYNKHEISTLYFDPGYQFSYNFGKVQLFYGVDLHFSYSKIHDDYFQSIVDNTHKYFEFKDTQLELGMSAIGGALYHLTNRISLSFETNISAISSFQNTSGETYFKELPRDGAKNDWTKFKNFYIKIVPISTINFNIHF